jgi:phenylalanyl-tRNA synthetase beta chain
MKVPLGWLRDYVDLPASAAQLAERLTLAGLEVSGAAVIGLPVPTGLQVKEQDAGPVWQRDKIVVGKILSVERHPNADRLTLATVDYGAGQPKTVVTGATNLKVGDSGQTVILGLSGSVLFDGHSEQKVLRELKPSKIRGIPSDAMVCSAYELGISDEHAGIIILNEEIPAGTPLVDVMGDIVLDLEITPNMARCLSMIGVAREVAALTGKKICLPAHAFPAGGEPNAGQVEVKIQDSSLCARYAALLLKDVSIHPAPGWMQRRLGYAGMRPINKIVDITNYVMLEWGQPLHAFDYDVLVKRAGGKAPTITVRPARAGDVLTTLDGVRRELSSDVLLIADRAGPIALAGIMGGAETEVSDTTKNILLESANFDFRNIRRTMKALSLPSEASLRFSRGVHPELARPAAERAAALMHEHAGARVCSGLVDNYPGPVTAQVIQLEMREVRRLLGMDFGMEETARILRALDFQLETAGEQTLRVTTLLHRLDIQTGSADLIEEVARIHGYDRLPATMLHEQLPEQHTNRALVFEEKTRDLLVNYGLQEVITYALTEPSREAPLGAASEEYVRLVNPISSERVVMRRTVLAGVLEVAAANLRHANEVRLFEIGSVYFPRPGEKLPEEPRRLAIVLAGRRRPPFWQNPEADKEPNLNFFDLKGIIETLAADLHLLEVAYRPGRAVYLHPGKCAELLVTGKSIGALGEMHPRAAESYGLVDHTVLAGEFDLETILAAVPERYAQQPVPRFPAALRDIAVIVDEAIPAETVVAEIRQAGAPLLERVRLFDLYRGESIPAGKKSLAYALTYQAGDRTLTDKEVDKIHKKIEDRLKHVLKAAIRGET